MPESGSILGNSVVRLEDPTLLTGAGKYVADLEAAEAATVVFVRSSVAHGTRLLIFAVLYSAWKVNGEPLQFLIDVLAKPFVALATMKPLTPVVRSVTFVVKPVDGSLISTVRPGTPNHDLQRLLLGDSGSYSRRTATDPLAAGWPCRQQPLKRQKIGHSCGRVA